MKFGKVLQQSQTVSSSEWESFWVDYKLLKHIIKDCAQIQKEEKLEGTTLVKTKIKPHPKEDNDSIRTSADEMNFFRTLRSEIKKIGDFFLKAQAAYISRVQAIEEQYVQLQSDPKPANKTGLMKSCVTLYKELLLLENFAVMNFCGISKILKKHDKWTGYATRNKFMRTILMKQPFATYLPLLQMIDRLEHIFMEATGCSIDQHDTSRRRAGQSTPTTSTITNSNNNSNNSNNGTGSATSSPVHHPAIPVAPAATASSNRPSRPGETTAQGSITSGGVAGVAGVAAGDVGYDSPVTLGRVHALRDDARHFRQIERVDESYDGDDSGDSADDATLQGGRSPSSERDSGEQTVTAATTMTTSVEKTTSATTSTTSTAATTTVKATVTSTGMGLRKSYNSDSDAAAIAMLSMKEAAAAAHSSAASTGMRSGSDSEGSARFKRKACSPLTPAMASNGKRKMSFATILN